MMISPSNPPPSSMLHPPLRCHLPNCQLPLSWAASFAPPGPKPSLRSVPPLPPPTHPAEPPHPATSCHKPPLPFHNPGTPPHSRYPYSPLTHHTFLGVYSPREDLKSPSHPLKPYNRCPPLPMVTPSLPPTCSPTRCLPGAGCCCSIILTLRGIRGGLNTSLHGPKWWYPIILMVGDFCNHPTTTHRSTLAHSHPPNMLIGTASTTVAGKVASGGLSQADPEEGPSPVERGLCGWVAC